MLRFFPSSSSSSSLTSFTHYIFHYVSPERCYMCDTMMKEYDCCGMILSFFFKSSCFLVQFLLFVLSLRYAVKLLTMKKHWHIQCMS